MKYWFNKIIKIKILVVSVFLFFSANADENLNFVLDKIQKDLKTLEKAVYSQASSDNNFTQNNLDQNSEDVLTRHLLKLSEIESQFQDLTNKFEEINFKLDKLSNELLKVQKDNQDVEIGSYPFFHAGKLGVSIVIRSEDQNKIDNCNSQILKFVNANKIEIVDR